MQIDASSVKWRKLGRVAPDELTEARLQVHWATQIVASVGNTLLEAKPDHSHTAMEWLAEDRVLAGAVIEGEKPFRAAVTPSDLTLHLLDHNNHSTAAYSIDGTPYETAIEWLFDAIEEYADIELDGDLERPKYELPDHDVANGAPFEVASPTAFAELARWFGNADKLLQVVAKSHPHAGPVLAWPHHFDIATLVSLDPDKSNGGRFIGIGVSPGDISHDAPYAYVGVYCPQPVTERPDLSLGVWLDTDNPLACLPGKDIASIDDANAQRDLIADFYSEVTDIAQKMVGA